MTKQFVIGIIFLLCLSSVQSAGPLFPDNTADYDATMCPTSGVTKTDLAKKRLVASPNPPTSTTTVPIIDGVSYVKDGVKNDNIEIRFKITGTSSPWAIEFKSTSASTVSSPKTSTRSTPSTAKPIVLLFQKNVLVTYEDTTYMAYVVDPTADHFSMTSYVSLDFPVATHSGTNTMSQFRPVCVTAATNPIVTVYIEGSNSGGAPWKDFIDYTINPNTPAVTDDSSVSAYNFLSTKPTNANLVGLPWLFYNRGLASPAGVVQYVNPGGYSQLTGVIAPTFAVATDQVYPFKLSMFDVLVIRESSTKKSVTLVHGSSAVAITASRSITTTTADAAVIVKYYSDNLHNILVVSDQKLVWLNYVNLPIQYEIGLATGFTGDDLKIYTSNRVGLAGDKAFALFSTEIVSYKIVSDYQINLFRTIALTGTDIPGASSSLDVTIAISCQCSSANIKRFTCFATTLTCLSTVDASWSLANCSA